MRYLRIDMKCDTWLYSRITFVIASGYFWNNWADVAQFHY
jgi:hypothetical protein